MKLDWPAIHAAGKETYAEAAHVLTSDRFYLEVRNVCASWSSHGAVPATDWARCRVKRLPCWSTPQWVESCQECRSPIPDITMLQHALSRQRTDKAPTFMVWWRSKRYGTIRQWWNQWSFKDSLVASARHCHFKPWQSKCTCRPSCDRLRSEAGVCVMWRLWRVLMFSC